MGFPRILSKNNKIYTKLGEFCLSGDSFWIVCHTCQEELQTQDAFWKHIQDEHNFLHGVAKEHSRTSSYCLTDVEAAAATASGATTAATAGSVTAVTVPLALYHCATKYSEEEQREVAAAVELHEAQQQQQQQHQQQQQQQQQHQQHLHQQQQQQRDAAKDMAELHAAAAAAAAAAVVGDGSARSNSGIDIKVEPSSLTLPPEMQAAAAAAAATNTTIYHLSQVVPAPPPPPPTPNFVSAGAGTSTGTTPPHAGLAGAGAGAVVTSNASNPVMQQACNTLSMTVAAVAAGAVMPLTLAATAAGQELAPKDSNSTTASASSAVSSDDGERWYICDYGACGLKFKYKSRMELHRVVHSKERRFNCDMCSASFKQSCNLSTHRKKKHAMRGIKSDLLPQRF
ncbi:AT-rich binding protein isoform X2 [Drosophila innubila]|uniref:AT-rich binding protein isoform X2 n=1 Tax=Drosophila innubila TaxID=198719 RepID=UPI00148B5D75|nr:AT-rich binding protein isoform X2 [Drosophila innubila]